MNNQEPNQHFILNKEEAIVVETLTQGKGFTASLDEIKAALNSQAKNGLDHFSSYGVMCMLDKMIREYRWLFKNNQAFNMYALAKQEKPCYIIGTK